MEIRYENSPQEVASMNTQALRRNFLLESLFVNNETRLVYSHYDRIIIGGTTPVNNSLTLPNPENLKANYFLERRELGIINVGGEGQVIADNTSFQMQKLDCLYLGKEVQSLSFESIERDNPALFFFLSAPAHQKYPNRLMTNRETIPTHLGTGEAANQRNIYKYIHPEGIESCQLVMGLTILETGSVWNTMPPHTHDRRMEVYFYFDMTEHQQLLHLMGQAHETRHLWVNNHEAVISPPWSIHAGCGTGKYAFIWGMAGENQLFTDMDFINTTDLL